MLIQQHAPAEDAPTRRLAQKPTAVSQGQCANWRATGTCWTFSKAGELWLASVAPGARTSEPSACSSWFSSGKARLLGSWRTVDSMAFVIYTAFESRRATVHDERCRYYLNRKSDALPSSSWHGTCDTIKEAESEAHRPSSPANFHVRGCRVCGTNVANQLP